MGLTITHAGTTQTQTSQSPSRGRVIRVTPTLDNGTTFGSGEVLFDATEIPNAVASPGGAAELSAVYFNNHFDTDVNIDLVFMQVQTNLGTKNSAVGSGSLWTEDLAKSAKVLGFLESDSSDSQIDLVNSLFSRISHANSAEDSGFDVGMLIQAEPGSSSIYFSGIDRTGSLDYGNDDFEFIFHIRDL